MSTGSKNNNGVNEDGNFISLELEGCVTEQSTDTVILEENNFRKRTKPGDLAADSDPIVMNEQFLHSADTQPTTGFTSDENANLEIVNGTAVILNETKTLLDKADATMQKICMTVSTSSIELPPSSVPDRYKQPVCEDDIDGNNMYSC